VPSSRAAKSGCSSSGEEGLDDQGQNPRDDDAVHPLQEIDLCPDDREFLVEADDVLTGAADLVLDVWKLPGLLLDALEAILANDQTLGRRAPSARRRRPPSRRRRVRPALCSSTLSRIGILGWSAASSKSFK
jgi:hypothetical protein